MIEAVQGDSKRQTLYGYYIALLVVDLLAVKTVTAAGLLNALLEYPVELMGSIAMLGGLGQALEQSCSLYNPGRRLGNHLDRQFQEWFEANLLRGIQK